MELRFIIRGGKRILQYRQFALQYDNYFLEYINEWTRWIDVPLVEEE